MLNNAQYSDRVLEFSRKISNSETTLFSFSYSAFRKQKLAICIYWKRLSDISTSVLPISVIKEQISGIVTGTLSPSWPWGLTRVTWPRCSPAAPGTRSPPPPSSPGMSSSTWPVSTGRCWWWCYTSFPCSRSNAMVSDLTNNPEMLIIWINQK